MSVAATSSRPTQGRKTARAAKLRYVSCGEAGIARVAKGKGFVYRLPDGKLLRDPAQLERIRRLALPPAWTHVWICLEPHGHLQATGYDARGRKQYRYDQRWRAARDELKYHDLLALAEHLPELRRHVARDMAAPGLPREKVLATVVALLAQTGVRVGNDRYREANGSFGLTTLLDRHVRVSRRSLVLSFRGKGGKAYRARLQDPRLARVVKSCRDVPGQRLFQYVDAHGERQSIGSGDVNEYLRLASGARITAKSFRTWIASVMALQELRSVAPAATLRARKSQLNSALCRVAEQLGNTVAICRKSYVHPGLIEAFLAGKLPERARSSRARVPRARLRPAERDLVDALQRLGSRRIAA